MYCNTRGLGRLQKAYAPKMMRQPKSL